MNPLLEINPAACLFVMGPQLIYKSSRHSTRTTSDAAELQDYSLSSPPSTYNSILEAGLSTAYDLSHKLQGEDSHSVELTQIKEIATKDGPTVAMEKLVELMKKRNCYNEWLNNTIGGEEKQSSFTDRDTDQRSTERDTLTSINSRLFNSTGMGSLQHFLDLQKQGALLACTQYDTILDSVAGTRPVTLQDAETLQVWSRMSTLPETPQDAQRKQAQVGILHLHGVCTVPSSVRLTDYQNQNGKEEETLNASTQKRRHLADDSVSPGIDILREIFRKRLVIFIGFDREFFDPLLPGFMRHIYPDNEPGSLKNPPILLTSMPLARQLTIGGQLPSMFLTLMVSEEEMYGLSQVISPGSPKNFTVGKCTHSQTMSS